MMGIRLEMVQISLCRFLIFTGREDIESARGWKRAQLESQKKH